MACFEVLEHVEDPKAILEDINRGTKDHGSDLNSVVFLFGENKEPYDFQRFTSFGLEKLLNESIANRRKKLSFAEQVAETNHLLSLEQLLRERLKVSSSSRTGERKPRGRLEVTSPNVVTSR